MFCHCCVFQAITQRIFNWLVMDNHPFLSVNHQGFVELMAHLRSNYLIPGREYFMEHMLPKSYNTVRMLQKPFNNVSMLPISYSAVSMLPKSYIDLQYCKYPPTVIQYCKYPPTVIHHCNYPPKVIKYCKYGRSIHPVSLRFIVHL